jgi:hypothetical protein
MNFVKSTVFAGDNYGAAYDAAVNELLGVNLFAGGEPKELIVERL